MKIEKNEISIDNAVIAKNTGYNLLGYGIPLIAAVILIPLLIKGLGDERFGILNLAWIIIGYFSFFDFGIGRGLTKVVSEKIGTSGETEISYIFWTSFIIMFLVSSIVSLCMVVFMPSIVSLFNITTGIKGETLATFYALAFSIPIVSTTAGLRGVLEAYQKFGIINLIRITLGIFTFLVPLIVLYVVNSLFWIVIAMIIIRVFIWYSYLVTCFRVNKHIKINPGFKISSIKPVLKFSIWITLANIVGPIIAYSDRFLIGALVSATALTYYATPYQVITKVLLIPGAFLAVLFPIFSSGFTKNPDRTKNLFIRAVKVISLIIFPIIFFVMIFAHEIMQIWLGVKFAVNSTLILQFLSIGILMNSLSIVPNFFFQGIGKPKIPTLINLVELPFYLFAMFIGIKSYGINGAAFVYMIAASIDTLLMYTMAFKIKAITIKSKNTIFLNLIVFLCLFIPFLLTSIYIKLLFSLVMITAMIYITWNYIFSENERDFLTTRFQAIFFK